MEKFNFKTVHENNLWNNPQKKKKQNLDKEYFVTLFKQVKLLDEIKNKIKESPNDAILGEEIRKMFN